MNAKSRAEKIFRNYNYGHAAELTAEAEGYVAEIAAQIEEAVDRERIERRRFEEEYLRLKSILNKIRVEVSERDYGEWGKNLHAFLKEEGL